jgi:hypothetical protein
MFQGSETMDERSRKEIEELFKAKVKGDAIIEALKRAERKEH